MAEGSNSEYARGYAAGRRKAAITHDEALMLEALDIALRNCSGWTIGGKPIRNGTGYVKLARVFVDNLLSVSNL